MRLPDQVAGDGQGCREWRASILIKSSRSAAASPSISNKTFGKTSVLTDHRADPATRFLSIAPDCREGHKYCRLIWLLEKEWNWERNLRTAVWGRTGLTWIVVALALWRCGLAREMIDQSWSFFTRVNAAFILVRSISSIDEATDLAILIVFDFSINSALLSLAQSWIIEVRK